MSGVIRRWLRLLLWRRPPERGRPSAPPPLPITPTPSLVHVTAAASATPVRELYEHLRARGLTAVVEAPPFARRAASGQVVAFLIPATFEHEPEVADALHELQKSLARGERTPLVVVWCVASADRFAMSTPHRTAPGYDESLRPTGWNASALFLGSSWRRHLNAACGDLAAATLARDRGLRRLFAAESHRRMAGEDVREILRTLHAADPWHLHTALVQVSDPPSWHDPDAVVAAVDLRVQAGVPR